MIPKPKLEMSAPTSSTATSNTKPITRGERAFFETMKKRHSDPSKLAKIEARLDEDRRNPAYF